MSSLLYPGLLHLHQDLHFKLKVRQFIEMVSGADSLDTETNMYGGRGADSSSEDMEEALDNEAHCGDHSANGNTSRNGNVEESFSLWSATLLHISISASVPM